MKKFKLPEILLPELRGLKVRQNRSMKFYANHKDEIDPKIPMSDALMAIDMGIDVTQIKINVY